MEKEKEIDTNQIYHDPSLTTDHYDFLKKEIEMKSENKETNRSKSVIRNPKRRSTLNCPSSAKHDISKGFMKNFKNLKQ